MTEFRGYLDRLRENVEVLDEAIANARVMSKKNGKDANALQWTKTLRDLVELRNATLASIKVHLLGRHETGSMNEPGDVYAGNEEVEFERAFQRFLSPWTLDDLKLRCEDCGQVSDNVSNRIFDARWFGSKLLPTEYHNLCPDCYCKRKANLDEDTLRRVSGVGK